MELCLEIVLTTWANKYIQVVWFTDENNTSHDFQHCKHPMIWNSTCVQPHLFQHQ